MGDLDVNKLLNALENETNASIMKLNTSKIKSYKNTILQQLQLDRDILKSFHKKLKHYRYCDDFSDLQYGYYIRWIPLKNPDNLKLTNGGFIIDLKIIDNNGISMLDHTNNIVSHSDLIARLSSFGWDCGEVDGHDVLAVREALLKQKNTKNGKPKAIIASTLKGRGVPGTENAPLSHIINPKPELIEGLLKQLDKELLESK